MKYRQLGRTKTQVSVVALGCDFVGATWNEREAAAAGAAIRAALDAGVNLFDTAEAYGDGRSEETLGQALGADRPRAIIATKVSAKNLSREALPAACERSLKRLRTEYIDLYQIHWPNREIPLAETMEALNRLREQGKIRAIGVSNFNAADLAALAPLGRVEADQLSYSLLFRAIEHELLPCCAREKISVICYSPMFQGLLTGKFASADAVPPDRAKTRHFSGKRPGVRHGQPGCEAEVFAALAKIREVSARLARPMGEVALAWALAQPGVTSVLAGARNPEQLARNVPAAELVLPAGVLKELSAATAEVQRLLGPSLHMWSAKGT